MMTNQEIIEALTENFVENYHGTGTIPSNKVEMYMTKELTQHDINVIDEYFKNIDGDDYPAGSIPVGKTIREAALIVGTEEFVEEWCGQMVTAIYLHEQAVL